MPSGKTGMPSRLFFVAYHPGSLPDYDFLAGIDRGNAETCLILCRHPYVNEDIVAFYARRFDRTIVLPDVRYEANLWSGFRAYGRWLRRLEGEISPLLARGADFQVLSDGSAYLPVNAVLSFLKKSGKCKRVISLRDRYRFALRPDPLKSVRTLLYTGLFGLYPVFDDRVFSHVYWREPHDAAVQLVSPYRRRQDVSGERGEEEGKRRYRITRRGRVRPCPEARTVVFYSDTQLDQHLSISREAFDQRMRVFFEHLTRRYGDGRVVCKPHPLDRGRVMAGLEGIDCDVYTGGLTSQMHLDMLGPEVRACYSVSSSSLLYSAAIGIPSYALYRYLDFQGDYPRAFLDSEEARENPFFCSVRDLSEIGSIDDQWIEPAGEDPREVWQKVLRQDRASQGNGRDLHPWRDKVADR